MIRTWKPVTAGILTIIAGALQVLIGLGLMARAEMAHRMIRQDRPLLGLLIVLLGIVAITGGIFAINRKAWGLALAGAICALLPPQIAVFGILSLIFISLGKSEFGKKPEAPQGPPPVR